MNIIKKQFFEWLPPALVAKKLILEWGEEGLIWLDGDGSALGRWVTLGIDPIQEICCRGIKNGHSLNPFSILRNLNPGHWTGWLSYEAAEWTEPKNPWKSNPMATLWIASHDPILKFDLKKKILWLEGQNQHRLKIIENQLTKISRTNKRKDNLNQPEEYIYKGISINSWDWLTTKENFKQNIYYIKNLISKGDLFQANLTVCCQSRLPKGANAFDLYERLRNYSPAPFGGLIIGSGKAKGEAIMSASPERFLKVAQNGEVETRPIKGTRPRQQDSKKDVDMAIELICSIKDRAENIMIVDLLRNDLGKICEYGSIHVPDLILLEQYPQVHHLTSVVKGILKSDKNWVDMLEAAWPGGSITGAPKLRACKRLHELEPIARGPYCGSIINIKWDGEFDSNILIRSLMLKDSTIKAHAGCGIVADSDADEETKELEWKLIPLLEALR
tara:strand:+ start:407 stop:1741 length:1335 start_codon:yes stop_codon:yes gene_type:complete